MNSVEAADPEPLDASDNIVDLEPDAAGDGIVGARPQSVTFTGSTSTYPTPAAGSSSSTAKHVLINGATGANILAALELAPVTAIPSFNANPIASIASLSALSSNNLPTQVSLPPASFFGATRSISGRTAAPLSSEAQQQIQRPAGLLPPTAPATAFSSSGVSGAVTVSSSSGGNGAAPNGSEWDREREELERRRVRAEVELLEIRRMHEEADMRRANLQCELVRAQIAQVEARTRLLEQQHQQNQQQHQPNQHQMNASPVRAAERSTHLQLRENEPEHLEVDASSSHRQLFTSGAVASSSNSPSQTSSPSASASQDSSSSPLVILNGAPSERNS